MQFLVEYQKQEENFWNFHITFPNFISFSKPTKKIRKEEEEWRFYYFLHQDPSGSVRVIPNFFSLSYWV